MRKVVYRTYWSYSCVQLSAKDLFHKTKLNKVNCSAIIKGKGGCTSLCPSLTLYF